MTEQPSQITSSRWLLPIVSIPFCLLFAVESAAQMDLDDIVEVAHRAGFACTTQLLSAVSIAVAESSLHPDITNPHPEYGPRENGSTHDDRGIWQISSYWWAEYSDEEVADPARAAEIAFIISNGGTDFSPWDSFKNGNAQRHYDRAFDGWPALRPVVEGFCQGGTAAPEVPLPRPRPQLTIPQQR